MKVCSECFFWIPMPLDIHKPAEAFLGECRRRSPGVNLTGNVAVWPVTENNDWCGDFVVRKNKTT